MSRFIKQLIYGFFYLAVAAGIFYGVYLFIGGLRPSCFDNKLNQKEEQVDCGGPCISCELKNIQLLRQSVEFFGIDGSTNAVITLSNPNLNYGLRSFTYDLNFYNGAKEKIFSLSKESFIYPAEAQKVIIEPNLKVNSELISGSPELILRNFNWKPLSEFSDPTVQIRQVKSEISGKTVAVSGLFANRESFPIARATIGVLLYQKIGDSGQLAGVSKTVLQDLKPFEERAFKVISLIKEPLKLADLDAVIVTEALR